jgi:hypothetical protein
MHAEVERDNVGARAALLRTNAAGEHVLCDVDLMFFAIDVYPGAHVRS